MTYFRIISLPSMLFSLFSSSPHLASPHLTSPFLTFPQTPSSPGADLAPLIRQFITERNTLVRGLAHPAVFAGPQGAGSGQMSQFKKFGAVSVSPTNIFEVSYLLSYTTHFLGTKLVCRKAKTFKHSHAMLYR